MSGGQVSLKYTHTPVGQSHLVRPVQVNLLQNNIIEEISITSLASDHNIKKPKSSGGSKRFEPININKITIEILAMHVA